MFSWSGSWSGDRRMSYSWSVSGSMGGESLSWSGSMGRSVSGRWGSVSWGVDIGF